MLKGAELLARIKQLGVVHKSEAARECGYVSVRKDGVERINYASFYEALAQANGVAFAGSKSMPGTRKLSYELKVQKNGNLLISRAYTKLLDLEPGDAYRMRIGRNGRITLIPKDQLDDVEDMDGEEELEVEATGTAQPQATQPQAAQPQATQPHPALQQTAQPEPALPW